jgi:flagellar protein FliO/FliZ
MSFRQLGGLLLSICCAIVLLVGLSPANAYADEKTSVWDSLQKPSAVQPSDGGGASQPDATLLGTSPAPSGFTLFLQVVFSLGLIIVLIYLLLRFLAKKQLGHNQSGPMRVVNSLSMGNGKSLHLVIIGDALYILGVGDNVQLIRHIPAGDEMDLLLAEAEIKPPTNVLPDWFPFLRGKREPDNMLEFSTQSYEENDQTFTDILNRQWEEVNQDKEADANWHDGGHGGGKA